MNKLYQTVDQFFLKTRFLPRNRDAHKGDFGHVVIIGGDHGMGGAVRLAAEAALRVGAGLVSVATRSSHVALVSSSRPEIMCHGIADAADLISLLNRATVVAVGPGLGKSDWSKMLFDTALSHQKKHLVMDADALNLLSVFDYKKKENPQWILTPHAGEAARLLRCTVAQVQENRLTSAAKIVDNYGGVCALKGAGTIIQTEDEPLPTLCTAGNPGMASGGMGDVLTGVIAGLLAQGYSLSDAAKIGVVLHATAGDEAAKANGERGLLALDLMPYLHALVN